MIKSIGDAARDYRLNITMIMDTIIRDAANKADDAPSGEQMTLQKFHLRDDQQKEVESLTSEIILHQITPAEIVQFGFTAEKGLQDTLDGFLSRLDKGSSDQVFKLFEKLEKGVEDANLPDVLKKIQNSKPSLMARILGIFRGKNYKQISQETYEKIKDMLSGKTQTLAYHVNQLEKDLYNSIQKLNTELQSLDELKKSYHVHMEKFGVVAAAAEIGLTRAKAYLEEQTKANADTLQDNPILQAQLHELQHKYQLLESRTLSLVGAYLRLPADHVIIQQVEQAGIATLQETTITASSRFASIKTTLLAVNGAFNVKAVQQIADRQAKMDQQLQMVRSQITKEIVNTAYTAPGDNRLAQAAQIEKIIADAHEIKELVKKAQGVNEEKFKVARARFEEARKQLSNL